MSIGPNPTRVRFDLFEADLSTHELYRHGFRIKLQQIPFRILAALIAVPGKLVTREELHRLLWPENSMVGFDHNLNNAVNKLRKALHDSLETPRYIETLPGRGYRFVSQVHSVQHALVKDFASVVKSRLVVLPFENKTGSDEHEFLCEGITDGLIAELGRSVVKGLGVIARNTSMRYKQSRLPLEQIAAELNVDYVLSGVVLFRGKQVSVSAELVDVKEQTVRWGRRFVRESFSLQDIEEEIATGVECSLASVLPSSASRLPSRGRSANTQANESYMKGRYYWNRRHEDGLSRAKHFFEEAIRLDPDFSLGYVGLADTFIAEATWGVIAAREAMPRAKAAAQKALRISEGLGEAYVSLGMVAYCFDYAPSVGNAFFQRAIERIPAYSLAHHLYGYCLVQSGRVDEGLCEFERALELDPLSVPTISLMGYGLFCARRFEACIRTCRRALEFDPNYAGAYMYLSLAQAESGLFDEAVVAAEKAVSVNRLPVFLAILAQVYARAGRHGNAVRILVELDEVRRARYVPSYWLAAAQLALRRKQASLRTLQKAYTERCPWLGFLKVDPSFDALRVAPAFRALLRKLGQSEISVRSTGRKARNAETRGK